MPYIDWLGKKDVVHHHKSIPYKTIECREEIGDADTQNMIIKGDNLLALKSLLPYYASRVKMIYIDPPYNTGNTSWVYNDNMDTPLIKKWLEKTVNAEDLSRSDKWLCMMYPRLKLLRELLKEDGVIFISIDDAEVAHLRMICDDIFGSENFVTSIAHKARASVSNDKIISENHNHILFYAKNLPTIHKVRHEIGIAPELDGFTREDENGKYKLVPVDGPGGASKGNPYYEFMGVEQYFRYSKETMEELYNAGLVVKTGTKLQRKYYLEKAEKSRKTVTTWWDEGMYHTNATNSLNMILGKNIFDTPKPVDLIIKMLEMTTFFSKNDIILDSFAGSGTTAHAVLEQNALDGGNRQFILIETMDYAKNITAERVKRVVEGYSYTGKDKTTLFEKKLTTTDILNTEKIEKLSTQANEIIIKNKDNFDKIEKSFVENTLKIDGVKDIKSFKEGIGGGFKYCELSDDIFDEYGELNAKLSFSQIAKHIYFVEFKKPIVKNEIDAPFVGSYQNRFLYFFEKSFKTADMRTVLKNHTTHKEVIVYTKKTSLSVDELKAHRITVRYIPYDIKDH
jgi:adenine-specific DNA-methyltransferase